LANLEALGGEVFRFGRVANDGDDGCGIDVLAKEVFNNEAAQLAGGSSECDHEIWMRGIAF